MKTALKTASTAIVRTLKRWIAWHKMRAVEIALADAYSMLDYISDLDTVDIAQANIRLLSRELCRTRAEYQSFLQPGQRIVFDIA